MNCKLSLTTLAVSLAMAPVLAAPISATFDSEASGIASDPLLRKVFFIDHGSGSVSAVDIDTLASVTFPLGGDSRQIVSNAVTHRVYTIHDQSPGGMSVLDGTDGSVIAEIPLGDRPRAFAADFRKGEIYVVNQDSNTLSIVSVARNEVMDTIFLDVSPTGIDLDSIRGKIYVTSSGDASVTVINRSSRAIEAKVAVGLQPGEPVVDELSGRVYISDARADTVSVLAAQDHSVSATIRVGAGSTLGILSPVYHRYYLPNSAGRTVSIIDTESDQALADVDVGSSPQQITLGAAEGDLYVVNKSSGTMAVADAATGRVSETFPVGANPSRVALAMGRVLVLGENGAAQDSLSVFDQRAAPDATAIATEYYHADFSHYFVSADPIETRLLADGIQGDAWERSMRFFRVWTTPGDGRFPVCRFFWTGAGEKSSHYLTPHPEQCKALKSDPAWKFEGISFYLKLPDESGACSNGTEPLYELYNDGSGGAPNHRLIRERVTRDRMAIGGWIAEGDGADVVFACAPALTGAISEGLVADARSLASSRPTRPIPKGSAASLSTPAIQQP